MTSLENDILSTLEGLVENPREVCDAMLDLLADKLGATQEKLLSERDAYRSKCVALERKCEALIGHLHELSGQVGDTDDSG